jgi:hypothetical protein
MPSQEEWDRIYAEYVALCKLRGEEPLEDENWHIHYDFLLGVL